MSSRDDAPLYGNPHADLWVLVVEHQPESYNLLRQVMQNLNCTSVVETDGSAATDRMQADGLPDVLIIGTPKGETDALSLCRYARRSSGELPIMLLVDEADDATLDAIYEAGATDFIPRPLREKVIRQRVRGPLEAHIGKDSNEYRRMEAALRKSEERHRIITEMISDYAYSYIVNDDGTLKKDWSTLAFHQITGYTFAEVDANGWERLIHPDDMDAAMERSKRLMAGEDDVTEFRIITKHGKVRWLRDHGHPVVDENGRVVHIYGAAQDITQQRDYEQRLQQQAEELQNRNEELDAFAYTVAHDLKNPISSMMGIASLVRNYFDRMSAEDVRGHVDEILDEGYKLRDIIDSLLMLSGVSKSDEAEITDLDMGIIVGDVLRRLQSMIDEYDAAVHTPEEWPPAAGYTPWVEQVWTNYISNAIKYGGEPPVVTIGADQTGDGMVRFYVRDNGSGLTQEEQQRIFTPFTRLNETKAEGHGLGLSIVQRIVNRLGGEVSVHNAPEAGAEFSFTLPVEPQAVPEDALSST